MGIFAQWRLRVGDADRRHHVVLWANLGNASVRFRIEMMISMIQLQVKFEHVLGAQPELHSWIKKRFRQVCFANPQFKFSVFQAENR